MPVYPKPDWEASIKKAMEESLPGVKPGSEEEKKLREWYECMLKAARHLNLIPNS